MHRTARLIVSIVFIGIFTIVLTACGTNTPSLGFAPSKQLVEKAIALQVSQTQQRLTQQLQSSIANYEITRVKLKQLEALFVEDLPTYHIRGTYNLRFNLSQQRVTQENNPFDVYLQRQNEGKTWRLAIPQDSNQGIRGRWLTYLIR